MPVASVHHLCYNRGMKTISVRIKDKELETRFKALTDKHDLSDNVMVQLLMSYALNHMDATGKTFKPTVIFSEES